MSMKNEIACQSFVYAHPFKKPTDSFQPIQLSSSSFLFIPNNNLLIAKPPQRQPVRNIITYFSTDVFIHGRNYLVLKLINT